jgi:DNA-binding CsgD family transcriptional regulator
MRSEKRPRKKERAARPRLSATASRDQRLPGGRALPGFDPSTLEALGLSRREIEVLELVARGQTNEQIATALGLSPLTVKKHLERMSGKLGAPNRAALVAVAWRQARLGS